MSSNGAYLMVEFPNREMASRFPLGSWLKISENFTPDIAFQIKTDNTNAWTLHKTGQRTLKFHTVDALFQRLTSDIDAAIAQFSRQSLFLHSGVVVYEGIAILLPGKSGSGKTTIVLEAILRGGTYYSDEYALVESDGTILPFARPLSVKHDHDSVKRRVNPSSLGAKIGQAGLRIDVVALCNFVKGAQWQPKMLKPAEAVLELAANTVAAKSRPEDTLHRMTHLASRCDTLKGVRGEASDCLDLIVSEYRK